MATIDVKQSPEGQTLVFGRSLFTAISGYKNPTDFTKWLNNRVIGLSLEKDVDFFQYKAKINGEGSTITQMDLTLNAAIRVAKKEKKQWAVDYLKNLDQHEQTKPVTAAEPTALVSQYKNSLVDQPELPLTPTGEAGLVEEKLQPAAPKTRAQQLLDEAKKLTELAQEEARREAEETLPNSEALDALARRFEALEKKVNVVLYFFQQASFAVRSLAPVTLPAEPVDVQQIEPAPVAEPTTRMLLVRLVNSYAAADRKSEQDTWKWLYGQLDLRKGFNVYAQAGPSAKGKDESYLAVIEQQGQIDELYKLAKKLMVLPELK